MSNESTVTFKDLNKALDKYDKNNKELCNVYRGHMKENYDELNFKIERAVEDLEKKIEKESSSSTKTIQLTVALVGGITGIIMSIVMWYLSLVPKG